MKIFFSLLFVICLIPVSGMTAQVGYADMELALASTKAGKKAKEKIEEEVSKRRKILEKSRDAIMKMEDVFKKQSMVWSEESKEKKRQEYVTKMENLKQMVSENEREMQKIQQKIAEPILIKMSHVLKKISKDKGYDVVVAKSSLLYAEESHDLTQELIKRFDKEYKGK